MSRLLLSYPTRSWYSLSSSWSLFPFSSLTLSWQQSWHEGFSGVKGQPQGLRREHNPRSPSIFMILLPYPYHNLLKIHTLFDKWVSLSGSVKRAAVKSGQMLCKRPQHQLRCDGHLTSPFAFCPACVCRFRWRGRAEEAAAVFAAHALVVA